MYHELEIAVLNNQEQLLGYLHPDYVEIDEKNEKEGIRSIEISHPLIDKEGESLSKYNELLVMGNKIWRNKTCDGTPCLYILLEDKKVNPETMTVSIRAEEIAVELADTPPIRLRGFKINIDDFEDGKYTGRSAPYQNLTVGTGSAAIISSGQLKGNYSLRHTGAGDNLIAPLFYPAGFKLENGAVLDVTIRLLTQGSGASTPYFTIMGFQYINNQNWLRFDTYYNGTVQKIRFHRYTANAGYVYAEKDLHTGKFLTNVNYVFRIIRESGTSWKFYYRREGSSKFESLFEAEGNPNHTERLFFGAHQDSSVVYDEIKINNVSKINEITVDTTFLNTYYSNYFSIGTVKSGLKLVTDSNMGLMELLHEIAIQNECEFQFRYTYNQSTGKIERYLDLIDKIGKTHDVPLEIGYNTDNIIWGESEADVRIAAAPKRKLGENENLENSVKYHDVMREWENLTVNTSTQIPLWVTTDDEGNYVNGPLANPPYPKLKGSSIVDSSGVDSAANYKHIRAKEGSTTKIPRVEYFDSSEEHPINLYWLCVGKIREKQQPMIKLDVNVVDIKQLNGLTPSYYNVGDTVFVKLPGRYDVIGARIISTAKDPRDPSKDNIVIGNYQIDFFDDYLGLFYPRSEPYQII